jgi:hypothetical protein
MEKLWNILFFIKIHYKRKRFLLILFSQAISKRLSKDKIILNSSTAQEKLLTERQAQFS